MINKLIAFVIFGFELIEMERDEVGAFDPAISILTYVHRVLTYVLCSTKINWQFGASYFWEKPLIVRSTILRLNIYNLKS